MNKLFISLFVTIIFCSQILAQSPAENLSAKIAQKMKDSLSLSNVQKNQLYAINMRLCGQKETVRQQYAATDSLRIKIQKIENTRDSLYSTVLTNQQLILYKPKKRNLVNNN